MWAVSVICYSLSIIYWTNEESIGLNRKTKRFMTVHDILHSKANYDKLYEREINVGRVITDVESERSTRKEHLANTFEELLRYDPEDMRICAEDVLGKEEFK